MISLKETEGGEGMRRVLCVLFCLLFLVSVRETEPAGL